MSAISRPAGWRASFERNRGRIATLVVLVVVLWFLLAFAEQAWRARELRAEADARRSAIAAIETENAALQSQLARYTSDAWLDYAQTRARRDLNLSNPGETVLMVRWGPRQAAATSDAAPAEPAPNPPNWRRWLDIFTPE